MKKTNKKGFTMVELVIVIAVIAILAAVLIPTFINLYRKANQSVDLQLITNLNRVLAGAEATDGKNETMHDALQDAFAAGYDITKISPTDEGDILWDQTYDRFLAVDAEGKVVACAKNDEGADMVSDIATEAHKLWKIYTSEIPKSAEQKYSVYWAGEAAPSVTTFSVGFDMGDCIGGEDFTIKIDSSKADIIVRMNENGTTKEQFAKLTVNAQSGSHIHLYGVVRELTFAPTNGGKLCVHAFVAALTLGENANGTLISDGAKYHQAYEVIDGLLGTKHETILAEYDCHYPNVDTCYFHEQNDNNDNGGSGDNGGNNNDNNDNPISEPCRHQHTSEDYEAPDCTTAGHRIVTCDDCKKTIRVENFAALGHDFVESGDAKAPTCEEAGHTAYKVCRRCHAGLNGSIIPPTMHSFDANGKCTKCQKMQKDVAFVELEYKDGKNTVTKHNMDGLDITVNSYIVMLKSDITITPEEFSELFGSKNQALFVKYENGQAVAGETFAVDYYELFAVDVDLSEHKLTIKSENTASDGIMTLGKIRVRDGNKTDNANLILQGETAYGAIFGLLRANAEAEFQNLTVDAKHYPIYLSNPQNKLTVTNSTLTMPEKIIATSALGQNVTIYFKVEATDGSGVQPNWDQNNWCTVIEKTYVDGKITLYTEDNTSNQYNVMFYALDKDGQKVSLETCNYFHSDYGWHSLVEQDFENSLMYFTIFGCSKEIKCNGGTDNTTFVTGEFEAYWFNYNSFDDEGEETLERNDYTEVSAPKDSVTLSKVAD